MRIRGKITYIKDGKKKSYEDIYNYESYDPTSDYYTEFITQDLLAIVGDVKVTSIKVTPMEKIVTEEEKTMNALRYLFS